MLGFPWPRDPRERPKPKPAPPARRDPWVRHTVDDVYGLVEDLKQQVKSLGEELKQVRPFFNVRQRHDFHLAELKALEAELETLSAVLTDDFYHPRRELKIRIEGKKELLSELQIIMESLSNE